MNVNNVFSKQMDALSEVSKTHFQRAELLRLKIEGIPPLTDLSVCKQLINVYEELSETYAAMADDMLRISEMFRYTYLINKAFADAEGNDAN